jgi:hypothetical protein
VRPLLASFLVAAACAGAAGAADFGHRGGPEPSNIDEIAQLLRRDPYDMELLVSFGTSKGGSAGHLALALRGDGANDDTVYSANFYADREPEHEKLHYTDELMVRIPKMEYLYRTSSSLGDKAAFGLDFGEVYKRSVVGIRVYGVPASERAGLVGFFARMNADYRARRSDAEYHDREVKYDYMRLNCAKTIGSGFKYGAGYRGLEVKTVDFLPSRKLATLRNANIPAEMAMKLMAEWNARGYRMDVVLYRKYPASTYVDPLDPDSPPFRELPDRFPSVMSLDFRNDQGNYQDYDNLLAMYLLYNLGRYGVRIDERTGRLEIARSAEPRDYASALAAAKVDAEEDSKGFVQRLLFRPRGKAIGEPTEPVFGEASEPRNRPPENR